MTQKTGRVSFQGRKGAYSHAACRTMLPHLEPLPCASFAAALDAVRKGDADCAVLPVENSIAGPVPDVQKLLAENDWKITGEYDLPVRHCLLGVAGAAIETLTRVYSHAHALKQCTRIIRDLGLDPVAFGDTAGSAEEVARLQDPHIAAIASEEAADIYGLEVLKRDVADMADNVTRFLAIKR